MDITGLSVKELESLHVKIAKEIEKRKETGRADALKKARRAAEEMGYTLEELLGGKASRTAGRKTVPIKYQHPTNNALTWTGRGKTPRWVSEWKAANGSVDGIKVS